MKTEFDYYIYMDYSDNLTGYVIIEKSKIKEILSKIIKLDHYRNVKHKREYLRAIKTRFKKEKIIEFLYKWKIREMRQNLEIFADIINFLKNNDNCIIFLSIDNTQYDSFLRILNVIPDDKNILILKENQLIKRTIEHRLSLIIDNILNLERVKRNEYHNKNK